MDPPPSHTPTLRRVHAQDAQPAYYKQGVLGHLRNIRMYNKHRGRPTYLDVMPGAAPLPCGTAWFSGQPNRSQYTPIGFILRVTRAQFLRRTAGYFDGDGWVGIGLKQRDRLWTIRAEIGFLSVTGMNDLVVRALGFGTVHANGKVRFVSKRDLSRLYFEVVKPGCVVKAQRFLFMWVGVMHLRPHVSPHHFMPEAAAATGAVHMPPSIETVSEHYWKRCWDEGIFGPLYAFSK